MKYYHGQPQNGFIGFTTHIDSVKAYLESDPGMKDVEDTLGGWATKCLMFVDIPAEIDIPIQQLAEQLNDISEDNLIVIARITTQYMSFIGTADCFIEGEADLIQYALDTDLGEHVLEDLDEVGDIDYVRKSLRDEYMKVSADPQLELFYDMLVTHLVKHLRQ